MIEFSFSQTDLFNELSQFKGQTRKSVMGMFKRPSIQSAKDIANFLAYNNLGGLPLPYKWYTVCLLT